MATNFRIQVRIDESELGSDIVPGVLRRIIQVLESQTLVMTYNSGAYGAGTVDVAIAIGTQTTPDVGFLIAVDSAVTADKQAEIVRRIIQALESETLSISYAVGSGDGTNKVTLTVT